MKCDKCGADYKVLRDQDDQPIRALCVCEIGHPCHQCKRGKVNHALLSRSGEVAEYACSKHGSPDATDWAVPESRAPSPGRAAAEAIVEGKMKAHGKAASKSSALVPTKAPPRNPLGRLKERLPLVEGRCEPCERVLLRTATSTEITCPACAQPMKVSDLGGAAFVDGVYGDSGPRGTTLIVTLMVERPEPHEATDVLVEIPRK